MSRESQRCSHCGRGEEFHFIKNPKTRDKVATAGAIFGVMAVIVAVYILVRAML